MNWDRMNRPGRGIWAGSLRYHGGKYWVYFGTPDEGFFMSTATDPAGPWAAGPALPATTDSAVACGPDRIWVATRHGSGSDLYTAAPGSAWVLAGHVDGAVTSLAVVRSREAFATLEGPARLETLSLGATLTATQVRLSDWVATIGGTAMRN